MFHTDLRVADGWLDDTSRQHLSHTCRHYRRTIQQVVFETHDRTHDKEDDHIVHVTPYVWVTSVGHGHFNAGCPFPKLGSLVVLESFGASWHWSIALEPDCPRDYKYEFWDHEKQAAANEARVEKHKCALLVGLAAIRRRLLEQFPASVPLPLERATSVQALCRHLTRSEVGQVFNWCSFWDRQRWDPTSLYDLIAPMDSGDTDEDSKAHVGLPDIKVQRSYDYLHGISSAVIVPCTVRPVRRLVSAQVHHCQTVRFWTDMAEIPRDWYRQRLTAFAMSLPRDRFRIEVLTYPLFRDKVLLDSYLMRNLRTVERDLAAHPHVILRDDLSMRLGVCCSSC